VIPTDLASFFACYEARDLVGIQDDPIDQLIGKYGTPDSQVQGDSAKCPQLQTTGIKRLRFDNVDDIIYFDSSLVLATPFTVFHVFAGRGSENGKHYVLCGDPAYNGGWGGTWYLEWEGNFGGVYQANAYPTFVEINSFTYAPDEIKVHCVTGGPAIGTFNYYIDNAIVGSSGDATGPGVASIGGVANPAHCDWVATIEFTAVLDATERAGIFDYIAIELLGATGAQRFTHVVAEPVVADDPELLASHFVAETVSSVVPRFRASHFVVELVRSSATREGVVGGPSADEMLLDCTIAGIINNAMLDSGINVKDVTTRGELGRHIVRHRAVLLSRIVATWEGVDVNDTEFVIAGSIALGGIVDRVVRVEVRHTATGVWSRVNVISLEEISVMTVARNAYIRDDTLTLINYPAGWVGYDRIKIVGPPRGLLADTFIGSLEPNLQLSPLFCRALWLDASMFLAMKRESYAQAAATKVEYNDVVFELKRQVRAQKSTLARRFTEDVTDG
jgi:hypothetical protein